VWGRWEHGPPFWGFRRSITIPRRAGGRRPDRRGGAGGRFTRKKHDEGFPTHAVAYCLEEAGLKPSDLDWVGFYDKPLLKFDRLLETYIRLCAGWVSIVLGGGAALGPARSCFCLGT